MPASGVVSGQPAEGVEPGLALARPALPSVTSGPGAPGVRCSEGPGLHTSAPAHAGWIHKAIGRNG